MRNRFNPEVRPPAPTDGRPPRGAGSADRSSSVLQQAVQRSNAPLVQDLARQRFQTEVQPGGHAFGIFHHPQLALSPRAFFAFFQPSPAEVEMAEALYQNVVSASSPVLVQRNLQAFLNDAVTMESQALIRYCVRLGADMNQLDHMSRLPLQSAVRTGNLAVVWDLLSLGANPNKSNIFGENSVEFAHSEMLRLGGEERVPNNKEIFDLLFEANGDQMRPL